VAAVLKVLGLLLFLYKLSKWEKVREFLER
jgi:hypothetical protein